MFLWLFLLLQNTHLLLLSLANQLITDFQLICVCTVCFCLFLMHGYVSCTAFAPILSCLLLLNEHYTVWLPACMRECVACQSQDLHVCWGGCVGIIESLRGCIVNCALRLYYWWKCIILEITITTTKNKVLLSIDGTLFLGFHMNHVFLTQTA